jgi:hypothetical protein
VPAGAGVAQENITIQNNRFLNNDEEGVVFFYSNTTAIDTIRILNNDLPSRTAGAAWSSGAPLGPSAAAAWTATWSLTATPLMSTCRLI